MAKSARASSRKRNNAILRAKVFGPATDARTARLSAKLQELISKPKAEQQEAGMEVDSLNVMEAREQDSLEITGQVDDEEDMDLDEKKLYSRSKQTSRKSKIEKQKMKKMKKAGNRKARNVAVFPAVRQKRNGPGVVKVKKR